MTRPDQEVSVLKDTPNSQLKAIKLLTSVRRNKQIAPANKKQAKENVQKVINKDFGGLHDVASQNTIIGPHANTADAEHEGFHRLTTDLVNKHGVGFAHKAYDSLLSKVPNNIKDVVQGILEHDDNYSNMKNSSTARGQLGWKEEQLNYIRDLTQNGSRRKLARQMFDSPAHKEGWFPEYQHFNDFDNHVKRTWTDIVNHAKLLKKP